MENWPIELQARLNSDSFTYMMGSTTIRSDMDVGPAKVRSRFTDAVDNYQATIFLDIDDMDVFQNFFKVLLNNGTNSFTYNDPFTQAEAVWRFVEPPRIRAMGGRLFEVSMNWERMT